MWRIPLDLSQRFVTELVSCLSREEVARAEQMLSEATNRRFVVSHGAVRRILSRYLNERPEEIRFVMGDRGKPQLLTAAGTPDICFNLSHSGEVALCAVTKGRDIGVDIEQIRPVSAWRQIAASYFSARENQVLHVLGEDQAIQAFFQGWTRKEAYSKALGEGVSQRWTQFSVSLQPGDQVELVETALKASVEGPFTLYPLAPGDGYVATVAVQGIAGRVYCWEWSWDALSLTG